MDKRFFLALLLTMGVIVITPRIFPGAARPVTSPALAVPTSATGPASTGATTFGTAPAPTTVSGAAPGATSGTAPRAPLTPVLEARTVRLTNALATYDFSTRGAALIGADLPRYNRLGGGTGLVRLSDGGTPLLRYRLIAGGDTIALDALDFAVAEDTSDGRARLTFTAPVGSGVARIAYALSPNNYLADLDEIGRASCRERV